MKRKWSWWRAWLVQTVEMLILGGFASIAEPLGALIYGIIIWAIVPLLGAVSAYRATRRGLNNYLAWLAPPICTVAVHALVWVYLPEPGPALLCALVSLIGAAAGEVANRETKSNAKEQNHG